jgi:hypothetical protein
MKRTKTDWLIDSYFASQSCFSLRRYSVEWISINIESARIERLERRLIEINCKRIILRNAVCGSKQAGSCEYGMIERTGGLLWIRYEGANRRALVNTVWLSEQAGSYEHGMRERTGGLLWIRYDWANRRAVVNTVWGSEQAGSYEHGMSERTGGLFWKRYEGANRRTLVNTLINLRHP